MQTIPPSPAPVPRPPGWFFVFSHPAHLLGLGFGSGLVPVAPGTAGTLCGWVLFLALQITLPAWTLGLAVAAGIILGWWVCTVSARNLRIADPGCVVWDEIAAFWLVLWLLTPAVSQHFGWAHWCWQLFAFVLFRFFDAVKPGPVRWADQIFKGEGWRGGWGIVFDDLVAAFCTLVVLALMRHFIALS